MDHSIVVHQADRVRRIVLNRPDKLNAITTTMWRRLFVEVDAAMVDDSVGVIVINGAGRAFSAGADMSEEGIDNADVLHAPSDMSKNRAKVAEITRLLVRAQTDRGPGTRVLHRQRQRHRGHRRPCRVR